MTELREVGAEEGEERMGLKAMTLGTKTKVEGVSGREGRRGSGSKRDDRIVKDCRYWFSVFRSR